MLDEYMGFEGYVVAREPYRLGKDSRLKVAIGLRAVNGLWGNHRTITEGLPNK